MASVETKLDQAFCNQSFFTQVKEPWIIFKILSQDAKFNYMAEKFLEQHFTELTETVKTLAYSEQYHKIKKVKYSTKRRLRTSGSTLTTSRSSRVSI